MCWPGQPLVLFSSYINTLLMCDIHADFLSFSHFVQPLFNPSMLASDPCWADNRASQSATLSFSMHLKSVWISHGKSGFCGVCGGISHRTYTRLLLRSTRWGLILLFHGLSPFFWPLLKALACVCYGVMRGRGVMSPLLFVVIVVTLQKSESVTDDREEEHLTTASSQWM